MQNNFRTIKNKTKNFTIIDNNILQDKNLSLKAMNLFIIPLPPLAEQKRIVEKLDKLLADIEELKIE